MSVCQSPETLSLCAHGRPVKFVCSACTFESLLESEKQETITIKKELEDEMLEYKDKVDSLSSSTMLLAQNVNRVLILFDNLKERIEKLESSREACFDQIKFNLQWQEKIEQKLKQLDELCDRICN